MSQRTVFAAFAAFLMTASVAARAEAKFGYVDLQRALLEVDEGRAAKARLQSELEAKQKDLDKEQQAFMKEQAAFEKQASAMSDETRNQRGVELQKKYMDLAQRVQKGKAEMADKEKTELKAIFAKMDPIIAQIAQREGFTMIFEKNDAGLVYAPASLDVTNELVRIYNDQHKASKTASNTSGKKDAAKSDKK